MCVVPAHRICGLSWRLLQEWPGWLWTSCSFLCLLHITPLFSSFLFSSCLFLFLYFPENQFEERERVKNESARNPGLNPGACTLVPLLPNPLEPSWPPDSRLQFP